jgi:hypothetical protein
MIAGSARRWPDLTGFRAESVIKPRSEERARERATGRRDAGIVAREEFEQADEVLAVDPTASKGVTHPETVIRARSLRLWSETGAAAEEAVSAMIEGPPALVSDSVDGEWEPPQPTGPAQASAHSASSAVRVFIDPV